MKKDIKTRWVAALRSGEFAQTQNYLRTDEGLCCLGVLCELAVRDEVIQPAIKSEACNYYRYLTAIENPSIDETSTGNPPDGFGYMFANLPAEVMKWAGLASNHPGIEWPSHHVFANRSVEVIELNDDEQWNFGQIADVIEKYVPADEDVMVAADDTVNPEGEASPA